jgi:hypothetical protein
MTVRLRSHLFAPPGYFQFTIPELGAKVWRSATFSELRKQFIEISRKHPDLGLPTDRDGANEWLEIANAMRVADIDGSFVDLTVQTPPEHIRRDQTCFMAAGGRFGDLMIILPGLKHIFDSTGVKPVVIASSKFATMLDGVSYADYWPIYGLNHSDNGHLRACYAMAKHQFKNIVIPKWWEVDGAQMPQFVLDEDDSWMTKIPENERNTYMTHQWRSCGWTIEQLLTWPLVFDRRDSGREEQLLSKFTSKRPFILFNFQGVSSPFGEGWKILKGLADLISEVDFIDLSTITAERIYDLLGLFDRAVCLITIDTATFHLSGASKVPTIHLQRDGHGGSLPRGNSVLRVQYGQVENSVDLIRSTIIKILNENKLHHHGV